MNLLSRINEEIQKTASTSDNFNETPPEIADQNQQMQGQQGQQQNPGYNNPGQPQYEDDIVATPHEEEIEGVDDSAEVEEVATSMGIQAANEFLSSIIGSQTNLSPDEVEIVSKTAGEIAGKITETMLKHLGKMELQGNQYNEGDVDMVEGSEYPEQGGGQQDLNYNQQNQANSKAEEYIANRMAPSNHGY